MSDGIKVRCTNCRVIIPLLNEEICEILPGFKTLHFTHTCGYCGKPITKNDLLRPGRDGIYYVSGTLDPAFGFSREAKLKTEEKPTPPLPEIKINLPQISLKQKDQLVQLEMEKIRNTRWDKFLQYYHECLEAGLTPEQIHAIINLIQSITAQKEKTP